jgi:hypothetical protein
VRAEAEALALIVPVAEALASQVTLLVEAARVSTEAAVAAQEQALQAVVAARLACQLAEAAVGLLASPALRKAVAVVSTRRQTQSQQQQLRRTQARHPPGTRTRTT